MSSANRMTINDMENLSIITLHNFYPYLFVVFVVSLSLGGTNDFLAYIPMLLRLFECP